MNTQTTTGTAQTGLFGDLEGWFTHTAWPGLKSFFGGLAKDEVASLTPIAQTAVNNLAVEEVAALVSGNTKDTGHILANVVRTTTAAAEEQRIKAGAASILAAVGGVVAAQKTT